MPEEQQPEPTAVRRRAGARITCSCPLCGSQELGGSAFELVVCAPDPGRSFYRFTCPQCSALVTRHASERVVVGLTGRGARVSAFPLEALEHPAGPALTHDDLLDLRLALASQDCAAILAAARGGA